MFYWINQLPARAMPPMTAPNLRSGRCDRLALACCRVG